MDMSFADQALSVAWLAKNARGLDVTVHSVPHHLDAEIARRRLSALGMEIDALTERAGQVSPHLGGRDPIA